MKDPFNTPAQQALEKAIKEPTKENIQLALFASNEPIIMQRQAYKENLRVVNERISKLREALRFYASGNHFHEVEDWNSFKEGGPPPPPTIIDRGETAKEALEE